MYVMFRLKTTFKISCIFHLVPAVFNQNHSCSGTPKFCCTFLKVMRSHEMPPKHAMEIGSWAFTMITGNIFHSSVGSLYHFSLDNLYSIWSKALLILWQSSLHTNINDNDQINSYKNIQTANLSYVLYDWSHGYWKNYWMLSWNIHESYSTNSTINRIPHMALPHHTNNIIKIGWATSEKSCARLKR